MSKRVKFFISHLLLSLFVIGVILAFVLLVWYPSPLAKAVGVTQIMLILASIDVVVGPVLGFLVYKEGKKSLKFDLSVIVLVQICALCFGVYSIAQGRPVWIVHNVDRFELVRNNEVVQENINQADIQFQQVSWLKPQFVATKFSDNKEERQDDMFAEIAGGVSIAQRPERYVSLDSTKDAIKQRTLSFDVLKEYNTPNQVEDVVQKYPTAVGFVPLKANAADMTVLVDKDGNVVKIVDLRPWK